MDKPSEDLVVNYEDSVAHAVDIVQNMFGDVSDRNTIETVVRSCGADVRNSIETFMKLTENINKTVSTVENTDDQRNNAQPSSSQMAVRSLNVTPSKGAIPKTSQKIIPQKYRSANLADDMQLKTVLDYHGRGYRTLIIMRGLPGSGKSFLAQQIVDKTVGHSETNLGLHKCSTDDFFCQNGVYRYDVTLLAQAHDWNHRKAANMMAQGISPVIIDNTNTEIWEMKSYCYEAIRNGYYIEILEPQTPWAKKPGQLARRNQHDVPQVKIKKMLDNYQEFVTVDKVLKSFGFHYPSNMKPPVYRNLPKIAQFVNEEHSSPETHFHTTVTSVLNNLVNEHTNETFPEKTTTTTFPDSIEGLSKTNTSGWTEKDTETMESGKKSCDINNFVESFENISREWDKGRSWEDARKSQASVSNEEINTTKTIPKPQRGIKRRDRIQSHSETNLFEPITATLNSSETNDWMLFSKLIGPSLDQVTTQNVSANVSMEKATMKDASTCFRSSDFLVKDSNDEYKVMETIGRDINANKQFTRIQAIPLKFMLDKSSMTSEDDTVLPIHKYRCNNEDQHFKEFRKMFKHLEENSLRDVFDKCCGDVNWAVEIILDGTSAEDSALSLEKNEQNTENNAVLESTQQEGDVSSLSHMCECVYDYNVVPKQCDEMSFGDVHKDILIAKKETETNPQRAKKVKKDKVLSESSMQLKKQFEESIVISDDFYSQHCLKIRKLKRGENSEEIFDATFADDINSDNASNDCRSNSENISGNETHQPREPAIDEDCEKTININLGSDFVTQLHNLLGEPDVDYPENIVPVVNMPISLVNQIYALWIESLSHQIGVQNEYSDILVKEDEDFARELLEKEKEFENAGKSPQIPDFKEIMDMELALETHRQDFAQWKNNTPNDMASRLTRQKLAGLFPDVDEDVLLEILAAHDNKFDQTVEVLLVSQGKEHVLSEKDGINKFIVEHELKRQEKALQEQREKQTQLEELQAATKLENSKETFEQYRELARKHLTIRNQNYNKAQEYCKRGMTQVASYYSQVAALHKQKYDQANNLAATALIQLHSSGNMKTRIDLHFLYVAEAMQVLDVFLDKNISALSEEDGATSQCILYIITGRGLHSRGGPKIKPAVRKRLQERGLRPSEVNPGLISTIVWHGDKLTHQLTSP